MHRDGCISAVAVQRRGCTEEDRGNQQVAVAEQQQQQTGSDSSGGGGSKSGSSVARSGSDFAGRRLTVDCSGVRRRLRVRQRR